MKAPNSYQSKDMANVKVLGDKQTDRWTNGWAKNYMPLIYQCGGLKINRKGNIRGNDIIFSPSIEL